MKSKSTKHDARNSVRQRPAEEPASDIDMAELHELRDMVEFVEKFLLCGKLPTALECNDRFRRAYLRADALIEILSGDDLVQADAGARTEPVGGWACDAIKLHLQMMHVAHERLSEIHRRAEQRGLERAKPELVPAS